MPEQQLRAAVVQMTSTADRDSNLETADRLVRAAAADGARLVVMPEKWNVLGEGDVLREGGEALADGPAATWARATAKELAIDLVAGSIVEAPAGDDGDERNSNTCLHVGPDGSDRAVYRKIHMFDVEAGGRSYRESDTDRPGEEIVTSAIDAPGGADRIGLGLAICYDIRFPELMRELAVRGALITALPAAFTEATTREHWELLVRARAVENQCFMLAANQTGEHSPKLRSGGRSMIVDPWGIVLAQAPDAETHVVCDLDLGALAVIRERLPSLAGRRPEVYGR